MEIEKKFKINNKEELQQRIINEGFEHKKQTHQEDTYYLVNEIRNQKRTYLRIREDIIRKKTRIDYHEVISNIAAEETEVEIVDVEKAKILLEKMGFKQQCIVNKKRDGYTKGDITIDVDEVRNLGTFIEIEKEGEDTKENENEIEKLQETLKLSEKDRIIKKGYPDLLMRGKE